MAKTFEIGPQQTVDRVRHPQRGEGRLVWRHGPAFFLPDAGEPVALVKVDFGGASSEPRRSWRRVVDPVHGELEADVIEAGASYQRAWHPVHGSLWLVDLPGSGWVGEGKKKQFVGLPMRIDPDEGRSFEVRWESISAGTPDLARKRLRATSRIVAGTPEEECWSTYTLVGGEVIAFRRNGSPDTHPAPPLPLWLERYAPKSKAKQLSLEDAPRKGGAT